MTKTISRRQCDASFDLARANVEFNDDEIQVHDSKNAQTISFKDIERADLYQTGNTWHKHLILSTSNTRVHLGSIPKWINAIRRGQREQDGLEKLWDVFNTLRRRIPPDRWVIGQAPGMIWHRIILALFAIAAIMLAYGFYIGVKLAPYFGIIIFFQFLAALRNKPMTLPADKIPDIETARVEDFKALM